MASSTLLTNPSLREFRAHYQALASITRLRILQYLAGIPEIMIGETLAAAEDPRPLPVITVDEPSLSVTIGINTSPLAGQDGDKLTASQVKDRLDRELVGNVSLRVLESDRPEVWEVQGRGELALSVDTIA